MKYVLPIIVACSVAGCSVFSPSPNTDPAKQQIAAHSEAAKAPPDNPGKPDKPAPTSHGCDAVDASGMVFTDANATVKTNTNKQGTHLVCQGHLPDGATLPSVEVSFKSGDGKTSLTCLDSWHESIETDGSFTKVCRSKAKKPHPHHHH